MSLGEADIAGRKRRVLATSAWANAALSAVAGGLASGLRADVESPPNEK